MTGPSSIPDRPVGSLTPILAISFIASMGTGVLTYGVFFLARHGFAFTTTQNFLLGVLFGICYVPSALLIGPILRRAGDRTGAMTPRRSLAAILLALAGVCFVPGAALGMVGGEGTEGVAWSIWLVVGANGVLSGILWPIIEAYVAGGRSGRALSSAMGRFNIAWATALVVAFWAIGPLVQSHPLGVLAGLGMVHLLGVALVPALAAAPPQPGRESVSSHPPTYGRLLVLFRFMLPTSFIAIGALSPYLPTALDRIGVDAAWQTPMVATYLAARVVGFLILERWHGWHGRFWAPPVGAGLMLGGFASVVLAPSIHGSDAATWVLLAGLAGFGAGVALIYAAALYYAMEVGSGRVDSGGTHEALIGVGDLIGAGLGLGAQTASGRLPSPLGSFEILVLILIGLSTLIVLASALLASRPGIESAPRTGQYRRPCDQTTDKQ